MKRHTQKPNRVKARQQAKLQVILKPHRVDFKTRIRVDMKFYFSHTDWEQMWGVWYLSSDVDTAGWKYHRLWDFIRGNAESQEQREFLLWYLGPKEEDWEKSIEAKRYPFIQDGPVDWLKRRNEAGWFNEPNVQAFEKELSRRMNSYERLMATAKYAQSFLDRAVKLAARLDKEFRYTFFAQGLTQAQNERRAGMYLDLHKQVQEYFALAHERYAKSLGINFDNMAGLMQIMQAAALNAEAAEADGKPLSDAQKAVTAVVAMTLEKFGKHRIGLLPEDAEEKIIEAVAEDTTNRHKKVN